MVNTQFMIFTKPPSYEVQAVSVVCRRGDLFLLVERAKASYKNWLAFPGGKIEKGETPNQAAKRELMEETNLKVHQLEHITTLNLGQNNTYPHSYYLSVYYAHDFTGVPIAGDDAAKIIWLSLEEMAQYKVIPSVVAIARQLVDNESLE